MMYISVNNLMILISKKNSTGIPNYVFLKHTHGFHSYEYPVFMSHIYLHTRLIHPIPQKS